MVGVDEKVVRVAGGIIINTWRRASGSAGEPLDLSSIIPAKVGMKILAGGIVAGMIKGADKGGANFAEGSFSVFNWKGYPAGGIKPTGPFRLLEGAE